MQDEGRKVEKLSALCEISLMRNHLALQNVANVPYRLIRNVLMKLKVEHLCKLEETNSTLIFEDEEVWLELLKKDFPLHVQETFVRKKDDICRFYLSFVESHNPALLEDEELIKNLLKYAVRKDPNTHKYRIPSRMLYFKYQDEVLRKQELSTKRLRLRMQEIQQEKQRNQIVPLEDPVYCEKKTKPVRSSLADRSDLFVKSYKEHQRRQLHFKSGGFDITRRPVKRVAFGGQVGTALHTSLPSAPVSPPPAFTSPNSKLTTSPTVPQKRPSSPSKVKRVQPPSIFLKRRKPQLPMVPKNKSPASTEPKNKKTVVVKMNSANTNKKKSSIFKTPSPQEQILKDSEHPPKAYIFDSTHR